MKSIRWLVALCALVLLAPLAPARAQTVAAITVSSCGSPPTTPVAGVPNWLTQDTTGKLCIGSTGGSSYTVTGGASGGLANLFTPSGGSDGTNYRMTKLDTSGVTYVRDDALLAAMGTATPAGTNIIGKVGIDQTTDGTTNAVHLVAGTALVGQIALAPQTTGGLTNYVLEPGASDNHANIKNGAGQVYGVHVFNNSATINYGRLYNAASGFNGCNSATNLIYEFQIPASTSGAGFVVPIPEGLAFSAGISICVTGAYGQTSTTSATASAISLNVLYK